MSGSGQKEDVKPAADETKKEPEAVVVVPQQLVQTQLPVLPHPVVPAELIMQPQQQIQSYGSVVVPYSGEAPFEVKASPPEPKKEVYITKDVVRGVLTLDACYRRKQRWPLFGPEALTAKVLEYCSPKADVPTKAPQAFHYQNKSQIVYPEIEADMISVRRSFGYRSNYMGFEPITTANVQRILFQWFPRLEEIFEFAGERIVAAGGAVLEAIRKASVIGDKEMQNNYNSRPSGDVDLFVVGVKEADAEQFLLDLWEAAFVDKDDDSQEKKDGGGKKKKMRLKHLTRGKHVITISMGNRYWDSRDYQIILRLYDDVSQVLGGFDLGMCACGFNTRLGVVMTPLCQFSLACGVALVDSSRRSTSMEYRLSKYLNRGFSIIFSSMQPPPIVAGEDKPKTIKVGKMTLLRNQKEKKVGVYTIQYSYRLKAHKDEDESAEDEDDMSDYDAEEHPVVLAYGNIVKAAKEGGHNFSRLTLTAETMSDLIHKPTIPGAAGLESIFKRRANHNYWVANEPILGMYQKWFGDDAEAFVVAKMRKDQAAMDKIVDKTVTKIKSVLEEASKQYQKPLEWITIEPGRQWTGSFKPIIEPASSFYPKDLYSPTVIGLPNHETAFLLDTLFKQYGFPKDLKRLLVWDYVIPAISSEQAIPKIVEWKFDAPAATEETQN